MLHWLWIGILVLVGIAIGLSGCVLLQYRRYRKSAPHPARRLSLAPNPPIGDWPSDSVTVTRIGHSTLYVNLFGLRFVTDPVFSKRIGVSIAGLFVVGPARHASPALLPQDVVGHLDFILVSHAHLDHCDVPSLRQLASRDVRIFMAQGTSRLVKGLAFANVRELASQDVQTLPSGAVVSAVPVRHWGNRYPWSKGYGWTGYLVEYQGVRVFFAGDTAYTPHLARLRETARPDIACLPISAYNPPSYQRVHCTPEEAWQMFVESGATWLVPIHFDTFVLSDEPVDEPLRRLIGAAGDEAWRIVLREHGEVWHMDNPHKPSPSDRAENSRTLEHANPQ